MASLLVGSVSLMPVRAPAECPTSEMLETMKSQRKRRRRCEKQATFLETVKLLLERLAHELGDVKSAIAELKKSDQRSSFWGQSPSQAHWDSRCWYDESLPTEDWAVWHTLGFENSSKATSGGRHCHSYDRDLLLQYRSDFKTSAYMDPLSSVFVPNAVLPDERAMVNSASKIQKFFRRRWSRSKQDLASDNGGYVSNVDDEVEAPQDVHSEGSETFSEMCPDEELEVTWMSMGDFRDQFFQLLSLDEIRDYHMEGLRDYDQRTWHRIAACDSHELQHRSAEDQIVGQCN